MAVKEKIGGRGSRMQVWREAEGNRREADPGVGGHGPVPFLWGLV